MKSKCYFGDCRDILRQLVADGIHVQTCVTSPPYWGLRDYGVDGQLGLEPSPDEFIKNMVEVFHLVRDVLADDGTLWLNMGDTYAGQAGGQQGKNSVMMSREACTNGVRQRSFSTVVGNLKPKDLVGIPWMLAFALRADGWFLRQDNIWHKPNPMPESTKDRCTKSHEYFFMLSKSSKYYFDQDSIAEPANFPCGPRNTKPYHVANERDGENANTGGNVHKIGPRDTRNKRSVWSVPTQPFKGAHFATFPPALIEPCILAGSRTGDTVLDPFFGSGTTGQVAQNLGRKWIGIELNEEYEELQKQRTRQQGLCLA